MAYSYLDSEIQGDRCLILHGFRDRNASRILGEKSFEKRQLANPEKEMEGSTNPDARQWILRMSTE
jgi:hypothetical protein